jgi:hypothetical protein
MTRLGKPHSTLAAEKRVLAVELAARPPWVSLTKEQLSSLDRGFLWGVVDSGDGGTLPLHRSKSAARKEAAWYDKVDQTITGQLSGRWG